MRRRLWPLAVGAAVLVGVVLRLVVLVGRWGTVDSDEAVVGLMARGFRHGDWRAFYWGQHYAGTQETALVALAGASTAALKLVPVALSAVAAVLTWRVGRRLVDERLAQAAGLLCWVGPGAYVWWSTKERGFYWVALVLGLVLVLAAQRIAGGGRYLDGAVLGVAAGLGFWASPNVLYFAVPAGLWLVARRPPPWRWLLTAVPGAALGALPWLWHNVGHDWPSLERPPQPEHVGYLAGIGRLLWHVLPIALNLRVPIDGVWAVPVVATIAYLGLGAAVLLRRPPTLVAATLLAFPLIYAWFPGAWFVGEGRYALFALPFLALAVVVVARRPEVAVAVVAVSAVLSVVGLGHIGAEQPRHLGGDLAALRRAGVDTAWADYWLAYRMAFVSGGW
ncbi:MAG: hypothetical protein JWN67_582, partial [Actinomycetia bacterium]|nr:hypothetical protein [Actinomycetes bacterium]